jgi:short subunit dehydrogenase-like uncharacterized protein
MAKRRYDVVLYGASGFTGKQTVQYFATHAHPSEIRWAIAGRNRQKLEAVKAQIGAAAKTVDVLTADCYDTAAVDAIVAQTRIMLNTAGPFALYGNAIVDACVRLKTHYVDITGETPWIRDLIDRYHDRAASNGTRIIPACGFDSVPSDLGTYLVVRYMQRELGVPCEAVKAYFQLYGGFNGGTLAAAFNLYESGQATRARDPFLLNPPGTLSQKALQQNRDPILPHYDGDVRAWVGPYFMGPVNTRIVRRSCALYNQWDAPYGPPDFTYQEFIKFDKPLARIKAVGMTAGTAFLQGTIQLSAFRHLLKSCLPQPGGGPSEETMKKGWFRYELLGFARDTLRAHGLIYHQGDPGNRATVKFLCEAALSLALQTDALPGGSQRGGILTPATGLGDILAERLRKTGMKVEIGAA